MAELISTNPQETSSFLNKIGFYLPSEQIMEVFPGFFPDRRVLRVKVGQVDSRVLKVRRYDNAAQIEAKKLQQLLAYYKTLGVEGSHLGVETLDPSNYVIFSMPYLGVDIKSLASQLELKELGYRDNGGEDFPGFNEREIRELVKGLDQSHELFSQQHRGIIHGDIIQELTPNNLLYNRQLGRLIAIDAEAFAEPSEKGATRFDNHLKQVEEWMLRNLIPQQS